MMPTGHIIRCTMFGCALALSGIGCFGMSQNPSYFPHLLPTGDIIRTHAKPPGHGYFADFDPFACRLEVRPESTANPIGTHQVYIATIYDDKGEPRRKRRVEWILEGPGNIIEVDESGYFAGRGYKVDNKYAVSYTDFKEHRITRGNDDPADDFMIRPGQTWCVVSGATEGETALTVYAPEIHDWDRNRIVVRSRWFDCNWQFPPPAVGRAGSDQILSSRVLRHSDSQPLPNYKVRYKIVDGPTAKLFPYPPVGQSPGSQELIAVSDTNGLASVRIVQDGKEPGESKVAVEILQASDASAPQGVGKLVNRSTTTVQWQAPKVVLSINAPDRAGVGQEIPISYIVKNTGQVPSEAITVRGFIPEGMELIDSVPPATRQGNQLMWTLTALPGGQQHLLQTRFRSSRVGAMTSTASLVTTDGLRADQGATTDITAGQLRLNATAPETAIVGENVPVQITLTNSGNGPITNTKLRVQYDRGLVHTTQNNPVETVIDRIEPGQARSWTVTLNSKDSGQWNIRVSSTSDGDSVGQTQPLSVLVKRAGLELTTSATPRAYLNQRIDWNVTVRNPGELPVSNVIVRGTWPNSVVMTSAANGRVGNGQVQWDIGTLAPGESRQLTATGEARSLTAQAVLQVNATADAVQKRDGNAQLVSYTSSGNLEQRAQTALEILGVPALQIEISDLYDPITVGGRSRYTVKVINKGTLPANDVELIVTLPNNLKFLRGYGPKPPRVNNNIITFGTIGTIPVNQPITFAIDVETVAPGDARFKAEVRSPVLAKPVSSEESTRILHQSTNNPPK